MRVTMQMLIKSNGDKRVMIFILLGICFVLAVTVSCQYVELKKSDSKILKNTNEIIKILTIGENNGN